MSDSTKIKIEQVLSSISKVPADLISKFSLEVYSDQIDAAFKAMGIK